MAKRKRYRVPVILAIVTLLAAIGIKVYRSKSSGLGKATAKKLRPPKVRLVYSKKFKLKDRPEINSSAAAVEILREIWSSGMQAYEEFVILLLDRANRVLGYHHLSKGGISGTVADSKLIFSVALNSLASSIIIAHNHPSGSLKPSHADVKLTERVKKSGEILDIAVLDHIILTKENHFSFADEGVL